MKAFFKRTLAGLVPDDDQGQDVLRGVKIGQVVAVEISRPRNIQHHRLYWSLIQKIANAIDVDPENVSDVLKLRTGHFVTVNTKSGPVQLPKSISFAKMDQAEFRQFFDKCCSVICMEWIPHMSTQQLQQEVLGMMGIPETVQ